MRKFSSIKKNNGLTVIELVIAMVVFAIIGSVMTQMVSRSGMAYNATKDSIAELSELRYAFKRMEKEIRQTDYTLGVYNIGLASPSVLTFTKIDGTFVTLTYTPASNLLELSYDIPAVTTATLLDNVNTFTASYYLSDGITTTTNTSLITFIQLDATINIGNSTQNLSTRIALRDKV
ncbi:MAG: prepilin-type N-terminal cleavage/methylation domain-containing protein [Gammaproteobacteria bacterium]|nr:prepilin-type N-terminal cleavage/methylation domain-containing protein [Gammaproteobacteria bacterium]